MQQEPEIEKLMNKMSWKEVKNHMYIIQSQNQREKAGGLCI